MAGPSPPEDPRYRPDWRTPEKLHPRLYRMTDLLDCAYAVILLTRAEFDGPVCAPPDPLRAFLALDRQLGPAAARSDDRGTYAPKCTRPQWPADNRQRGRGIRRTD